jgi:cell division protein FtsW (lipid II flippase)
MNASLNIAGALVLLAVSFTPYRKKKLKKICAALWLMAGIGLGAAFLGDWVSGLARWIGSTWSEVTPTVVFAIGAIIAGAEFIHDMWPKNKAHPRYTALFGLMLPSFAAGTTGIYGDTCNRILNALGDAAATWVLKLFGV